ncbi:MAG: C4-dicarboxylate-binding periplasmic protein precursor [Smithella sp. PtaU1.Bin162]|nr:MAG: C4-dicarboxylate-binding periplasmic protein precursor [Smithella sp. PtaU1.Bin162]
MKKMKIVGTLLLVAAFIVTGWGLSVTSAQAKTTLKYAHGARTDFSMHPASLEFKKVAEQDSKGSLEVTIFPNAALGPEREFIEALMMGNVDLGITTGFTLSNLTGMKELLVYEMPWLIGDRDIYYRAFAESKSFKTIKEKLEAKGIKFMGAGDIGSFAILAKKPIRTPADVVGMKIRTGENPLIVDVFKAMNVKPVVVNFGELFTAFQQGVMDGLYTTTPLVHMTKTYEVAKELTQLNNVYCMAYLVMNLKKFNSLSKEEQAALEKAGAAYTASLRKATEEQDRRVVQAMEKTGLKFYSLNAKEMEPFQKILEPIYKSWRDKIGAEIFDDTKAFVEKAKKAKK